MDTRTHVKIKRVRWIGLLLAFILIGTLGLSNGGRTAHAAKAPLELVIEQGFDGRVKDGRWFPVKMTITNPGDSVTGDLAITMSGDAGGGKNVVYTQHVDLPKQSTKVVWFTLPGKQLNANNNIVLFYEGSVEGGKPIAFKQGDVSIVTRPVPMETLMVGVLARDPDTLNFLSLLNQKGYQVQTIRLEIGDFPWESAMLDSLDVIALNDSPTAALRPEQAKEIQAWVERGGKLVLAGGAGYAKAAAPFADISPVTVTGTTSLNALTEYVKATGKELTLDAPFTVSTATVKDGETLFAENDIPLVVSKELGQGAVLYVAYDLALQPVASWSGNPTVWERVLSGSFPSGPSGKGGRVVQENGLWELNQALEIFPQLIPPAYGMLALLFLAYAVIVAPALYFLLKKIDRREWAWFAIPAVAVVTSLIIYGIGASGRGSTLAQTLGINELSGSGTSTRTAASSVFVPSGGDYELEWSGKRNISPIMVNDGRPLQAGEADMIVRAGADRTIASFENVPFWSVRKAFAAQESVTDAGKFEYTVTFDSNGAKGEVVNATKHDLYEAGLFIGGQWIRLGDMKQGEKKPFQTRAISSPGMMNPDWGSMVFPYTGSQDLRQRERALLNGFSQQRWNGQMNGQPMKPYIVAFAQSKGNLFKIDGKDVSSERIDLFVQPIVIDYVQGDRVFIPRGMIVPFVDSSSVTHMSNYYNGGIDVGQGEFTLRFQLPERKNWEYGKITLNTAAQNNFSMELWNEAKQAWEPLQSGQLELTADRAKETMASGRDIRIKVKNSQNGGRFTYPELSAEGVVKR